MIKTKKHLVKKWEVSFIKLSDGKEKRFKVTRRIPDLSISETRIYKSKKEAKKRFDEWLK